MVRALVRVVCVCAMVVGVAGAGEPPAGITKTFIPEADVTIEGKAATNGGIELTFQAMEKEPKVILLKVAKGQSDKDIGEALWKELRTAAGGDYVVDKKDGGRTIRIKKRTKEAKGFAVAFTWHNVSDVRVGLELR